MRGMDRTEIETHGVEEGAVKVTAGTLSELNLLRIGSDAPVNETTPRLKKWIGGAKTAVRYLHETGPIRGSIVRPAPCRRNEDLGFAEDAAAAPFGDGDKAPAP